jgi:hypothetical protein
MRGSNGTIRLYENSLVLCLVRFDVNVLRKHDSNRGVALDKNHSIVSSNFQSVYKYAPSVF